MKTLYTQGDAAAIPFFKRATELDPNFALAHAILGNLSANLNQPTQGMESIKKAYELRGRVSEREKLSIEVSTTLALQVTWRKPLRSAKCGSRPTPATWRLMFG